MQPEVIEEGVQSNFLSQEDIERFSRCKRFYLETSAFNFLVDNLELADIELTRAYQRRKGVIFATSPMLLWEIMLTSDLERADMMLLAAQALFDPILLGTPTELAVRYLRFAYPDNVVNYDIRSNLGWAGLWPNMTRDFQHTFVYDFVDLIEKTKPIRAISKSLTSIIEGLPDRTEIVELTSTFVTEIYGQDHCKICHLVRIPTAHGLRRLRRLRRPRFLDREGLRRQSEACRGYPRVP
jgi:hypothetical protein